MQLVLSLHKLILLLFLLHTFQKPSGLNLFPEVIMLNWHSNTINSPLMAISARVSGQARLLGKWLLQNF